MPRLVLDSATGDDPRLYAEMLSHQARRLTGAIHEWANYQDDPEDPVRGFTIAELARIGEEADGPPDVGMEVLLNTVRAMRDAAALLRRLEHVEGREAA